ncbi:hypothetical protein [Nostoc sp.]|uniref:hypothetical protein n=1 Tax=Nostoc sp. TaxID=1180 RepID=UPI002FFCA8EC
MIDDINISSGIINNPQIKVEFDTNTQSTRLHKTGDWMFNQRRELLTVFPISCSLSGSKNTPTSIKWHISDGYKSSSENPCSLLPVPCSLFNNNPHFQAVGAAFPRPSNNPERLCYKKPAPVS